MFELLVVGTVTTVTDGEEVSESLLLVVGESSGSESELSEPI